MFRESCIEKEGIFFKDLRLINRDLAKVILVDNNLNSFSLQPNNGIPIKSWFDDPDDVEL
jgi:CTD small phosphatase-like protein 2